MLNLSVALPDSIKSLLRRVYDDQASSNMDFPTTGEIFLCVFSALLIGFLIALVYMFTHRKTGYARSYVLTMPMLTCLVATVIITMCLLADSTTGLTAAISLTGAFALVRFRSVPGDPRDIAYVFFAMAMGVVCGIGYVGYAYIIFAVLSLLLIILDLTDFAAPKTLDMTLKITIPEDLNYNGLFDAVLQKYTKSYLLRRVKTTDFGTLFDLVYSIQFKEGADQKKFIDEIRALNGNLNVTLVLYRYDDQIYDKQEK